MEFESSCDPNLLARLILVHTRGWEDGRGSQDSNILIWRWNTRNVNVIRDLWENLPLSQTTKIFLCFWITVKAFFSIKHYGRLNVAVVTRPATHSLYLEEPNVTLEVCQGRGFRICFEGLNLGSKIWRSVQKEGKLVNWCELWVNHKRCC